MRAIEEYRLCPFCGRSAGVRKATASKDGKRRWSTHLLKEFVPKHSRIRCPMSGEEVT